MLKSKKNNISECIYTRNASDFYNVRAAKKKIERLTNAFMEKVATANSMNNLEKILYEFKYGMVISDVLSCDFSELVTKEQTNEQKEIPEHEELPIGIRGYINKYVYNMSPYDQFLFEPIQDECGVGYIFNTIGTSYLNDDVLEIKGKLTGKTAVCVFRKVEPECSNVYTLCEIEKE